MIIRHATEGGSAECGAEQHLLSRNQVTVGIFQDQFQIRYRGIIRHNTQWYCRQRGFVFIQIGAVRCQSDSNRRHIQRITADSDFNHCITGGFSFQRCSISTILIISHCTERGVGQRSTKQHRLSGHQVTVGIFQCQLQC